MEGRPVDSAKTTMRTRQDVEITERLELRALEKMTSALCRHIELLMREARYRGRLRSREDDFQLQVFDERRAQAEQLLESKSAEPCETRIARFEQIVNALDCSRDYFLALGHQQ